MAKVVNKDRCLAIARELGIDTPQTVAIASLDDLEASIETLSFPVVLKWSNPHLVSDALAARDLTLEKVEYASDPDELRAKLRVYDQIGAYPLIQSYCPGHGVGQMFLIRDGVPQLRFQHRRLHEWPPEGGFSSFCEAIDLTRNPEVQARSLALLRALDWEGAAMVEYRHDPVSGRFVLMEVNGRFWGSQALAFHAGAHFAWHWLAGRLDLPPGSSPSIASGLRCRYMIPETYRLLRILFARDKIGPGAEQFSRFEALRDFLLGFVSPRTRYYVFWLRDPKPFLADLWFIAAKLLPGRRRPPAAPRDTPP